MDCFKRHVSLESRYGMCCRLAAFLPNLAESARAVMTYLSVNNDLLMSMLSFYASPVVPVALCLSLPAKSTNYNLLTTVLSTEA